MRDFTEFIDQREAALEEFDQYLQVINPELHEDWRGTLGGIGRGLASGAKRAVQNVAGGAGQALGGLATAAGSALQGDMPAARQGLGMAATGAQNVATFPLQAGQAAAQSFQARDANAVQSVIKSVNDPRLKQALAQAFQQWQGQQEPIMATAVEEPQQQQPFSRQQVG